jgi:hypothetical protein
MGEVTLYIYTGESVEEVEVADARARGVRQLPLLLMDTFGHVVF